MILNIAHRGGAGLAPENTLSCFNEGMKYAGMIEFDVQPSSDHHLMVFHDRDNIERTTNGQGCIPELPFNYLRSLDAGSWFHERFRGEQIPTLSEVLLIIPSPTQLNIELKFYDERSDWFEKSVVSLIQKHKLHHRTVIMARHVENIQRIHNIDNSLVCGLLQKERLNNEYLELLLDLELNTAQIRNRALKNSFIQQCHDHDIRVFYFYADEPQEMQQAITKNIDGILTNFPDRLKALLTKKE
ncbi:MAG: glycerophosphodiester phosphodiesterase [Candidatus Hodarchaeales archaeon]|jgi:glycerophosphoryl diester phosphodiesterase